MYFVNRSEIEQILLYFEKVLSETTKVQRFSDTYIYQLAMERMLHVLIESMLDVGNKMIDGFIMRDPGSYHDIIEILIDENVIPKQDMVSYKTIIDARQIIVQKYYETDADYLQDVIRDHINVLHNFPAHIRNYMDNELGVANAFSNESKEEE